MCIQFYLKQKNMNEAIMLFHWLSHYQRSLENGIALLHDLRYFQREMSSELY